MPGPDELPPAGVPPEEAIRFFRSKGFIVGFSWQDVFRDEHARWFTVAKAMTRDLLEEIRAVVDAAIADGATLSDFKKTLRPKLQARGWWGKRQMLDPATGQHELVQLGSERRLRTIFDTNLRTAYSAGKWERFQRTKAALPFVEYSSMMDGRERPQHHGWNGTILPIDDPWWDTHWPPCDWNCRCSPVQRSQRMLDRQGKTVTETPIAFPKVPWTNKRTGETGMVEKGIGKGWDYNVGKEHLRGLAPRPLPGTFDDDEVGAAAQLSGAQQLLVDRFVKAFGVEPGGEAIWRDRDGWPLSIGRGWFLAPGNRAVVPPSGVVLGRIVNTIRTPDSIRWIWVKARDGRQLLMRRYASIVGQLGMIVDIGGEGWRWAMVPADEIAAAYNPRQARDGHGRWTSGHSGFLASLSAGQPSGSGLHAIGDVSPATTAKLRAAGVAMKSPAVWLEHGRARHIIKRHGADALPITKRHLTKVGDYLDRAHSVAKGRRKLHGVVDRIEVKHRSRGQTITMVFEARRRGLTLHTMFRTKGD